MSRYRPRNSPSAHGATRRFLNVCASTLSLRTGLLVSHGYMKPVCRNLSAFPPHKGRGRMSADNTKLDYDEFVRHNPGAGPKAAERIAKEREAEKELAEESCVAFGFLRGLGARALAIEFRF